MDADAAASAEDAAAETISGPRETICSPKESTRKTPDHNPEAQVLPNTSCSAEDLSEMEEMFCCEDCGEVFSEEAALSEHQHHHQESRARVDKMSSVGTENEGEPANFCSVCSLSFADAGEFNSHMEKNHSQPPEVSVVSPVKNFSCLDCGKSYYKYGFLLNHMRRHHETPPKSLFSELEHLKTKSFNCETCGRSYSRATALDAHRRCHETLFKFRKGKKSHHVDSSPEEKPAVEPKKVKEEEDAVYECTCGKSFASHIGLKTHQRFSQNTQCSPEEKLVKTSPPSNLYCGECKKFYKTKITFLNHQRWHEKSADPSKRFTCEECGKTFMLLEYYFRHQRSHDIPEKSFQHQVGQVQKKQFECTHCGLKFSRASAFQSHQLRHSADVDPEPMSTTPCAPLPSFRTVKVEDVEKVQERDEKHSSSGVVVEDGFNMAESDDDMQSYDPADFNVEVISASESEEEPAPDPNPELELECDSDQEAKEGFEVLASKQDLNIVEVDFEPTKEQCDVSGEAENGQSGARFKCPDCHRWFSRQVSLRVHRTWHRMYRKRGQMQGQLETDDTHDTAHSSLVEEHIDESLNQDQSRSLICNLCGKTFSRVSALVSHQLNHPKKKPYQCSGCMMSYSHEAALFKHLSSCSARERPHSLANKKEYNPTKTLLGPKIYHCEDCGKGFWSLGAYAHHKQNPQQCADLRLRKGVSMYINGSRSRTNVACPVCGRKFRHQGILSLHMRKHETGNHKCELCDRTFRLFSSLLRHQVVHSSQLPPPIKSFQHQVEQVKKNTYSCPDCGKLFSREKALQFHMKSHGYETGYSPSSPGSSVSLEDLQCETCQAHFKSKSLLRAHRKLCVKRNRRLANNDESLKPLKVDKGPKKTSHPEVLALDVDNTSQTQVVAPEVIDTSQPQAENPTLHCYMEYKNTIGLKYKCDQCDKSFPVVGALNLHKRIHARARKFLSKAKSVSAKSHLQEKVPTKGAYRCLECGRGFATNTALGSHKRCHVEKMVSKDVLDTLLTSDRQTEPDVNMNWKRSGTLESNLECPHCDELFEQNSLLLAHIVDAHGQSEELTDVDLARRESNSTPKAHQCLLCPLSFTKIRGLRAHKWQFHAETLKSEDETSVSPTLSTPPETIAQTRQAYVTSGSSAVDLTVKEPLIVGWKPDVKEEKTTTSNHLPVKYATGLDSRKQSAFVVGNSFDLDFMTQENQLPEATSDVSSPTSRLSEPTNVKCFFKCAECGKGFQTEEQLTAHKLKAKSKPHCCALCCQSFWTGNQLQQHLAWHDEVRLRLPNEVRLRLSAALSSTSLKPNVLMAEKRGSLGPNRN